MVMSCERCRESISDRIDGHDDDVAPDDVEAHLRSCPECRDFERSAHALRRGIALAPAPAPVAVEVDRLVRTAVAADRDRHPAVLRWLLGLVAVQIAVLALPDFLASEQAGHSLRHLGAFSLAYAAGLAAVVVRPARARTVLNVSVVLLVALAATAAVDVVRGQVPLASETPHVLELASAWLLWMLSRPGRVAGAEER